MVLAIGFGVSASAITYSAFLATSGDPIPQRSASLFTVLVDNNGPDGNDMGEPQPWLSYKDGIALLNAHQAPQQALLYPTSSSVIPDDAHSLPFTVRTIATTNGFFPMFMAPFAYGGAWSNADDDARAHTAVISYELNARLFGGANSVGRTLNLDQRQFRIAGVLAPWHPTPRFFDLDNARGFGSYPDIYLPLHTAADQASYTIGGTICAMPVGGTDWASFVRSECDWVSLWVQLPTAADVTSYRSYLQNYASDQQRAGRFSWAPNVRLYDVMQWLRERHVVPSETLISCIIAFSFLLICLVNTAGLLLAKFMRRAGEIGLRRALGASRADIYGQFLSEAAVIGFAGGILGILLTAIGLLGTQLVFAPEIAKLLHMSPALLLFNVLVAIAATALAALYPIRRATQVQPALQIKIN